MTTSRLAILLALLLGGMSSIFLLPRQLGFQPAGINLELPKMVGGWYGGKDMEISEKERGTLGPGTEFARKSYRNGRGFELVASIVLSGEDMNQSIHRPERCLPAQGYSVIGQRTAPIARQGMPPLGTTRLYNVRNLSSEAGVRLSVFNLTYYWFAGHTAATGSHTARTWLDMKDRLVHGYNQRWAYITVSAVLPPGSEKHPEVEQVVDEWIQDFIKRLLPVLHQDSLKQPS